jgi:hypothetical protein
MARSLQLHLLTAADRLDQLSEQVSDPILSRKIGDEVMQLRDQVAQLPGDPAWKLASESKVWRQYLSS